MMIDHVKRIVSAFYFLMDLAEYWISLSPEVRARIRWMDEEIRAERHPSCEKLCRRFNIQKRSATKVLAAMRENLRLPVDYSRKHEGYRYRADPPALPQEPEAFQASRSELGALELAAALAAHHLDAHTTAALRCVRDRLLAAAAPAVRREAAAWSADVVFTGPPPLRAPHLDLLRAAVRERRVLEIDYRSPRHPKPVTRVVEPHFLWNAAGDWLLVAWDRNRSAPRTFALARLEGAPVGTGETFTPRPELDPGVFTRHAWLSEGGRERYEIVVGFTSRAAQLLLERKWHPSQRTRPLEDGSCEVTLEVSGEEDLLRWLRGFGPNVEVLRPARLRERLAEEAERLTSMYRPE